VDIAPDTANTHAGLLEDATNRQPTARRPFFPVDAFGRPARLDVIREIADRHGLVVIEDCCWGGRGGMTVTDDDRIARLL